ncbi:TetR/AcrR family transcriptional regulator [Microbacterium sp. 22242]|uniref:TetR/AcrR family transcriptional regulator n=1 Tax=Microbacterium sp. 22242 TaxID=3453896 RepID=UPI003F86F939
MARPPHARERVLDAFEALLISEGERATTLDAVARAASVSKGGLLYHFGSKDELAAAMIARLERLADEDVAQIRSAPEGPVEYYLRTSVMMDDALDRAIIAVSRLAQGGSGQGGSGQGGSGAGGSAPSAQGGNSAAIAALHRMREESAAAIRPHVRDQAALDLVMLVSDGLFFNNALDADGSDGVVPTGAALDALIALVVRATLP